MVICVARSPLDCPISSMLNGNRELAFRCVISLLVIFTACNSETNKSTTHWKEARFEKVVFKYPNDWRFEKESRAGTIVATAGPDEIVDSNSPRPFEIIQSSADGHSWEDFKERFLKPFFARTDNEVEILNRKDTIFKNLRAVTARAILFNLSTPLPAKIYAVDGGDRFYLITILSFKENDATTYEIDEITKKVLESLTIQR